MFFFEKFNEMVPLHYAVRNKNTELVKLLLLNQNLDPNIAYI